MRSMNEQDAGALARIGTTIAALLVTAAGVYGCYRAGVPTAQAHMAQSGWKYDGWCCNGDGHNGDCQEIPDASVRITSGGYEITLKPGDHRLVTETQVFIRSFDDVRPSPDGLYHACLYPSQSQLRCFYAPGMSS